MKKLRNQILLFLGLCLLASANIELQAEGDSEASSDVDNTECDLVVEGPICLFNGQKIIVPDARPKGLVGYWTFDDSKVRPPLAPPSHLRSPWIPLGARTTQTSRSPLVRPGAGKATAHSSTATTTWRSRARRISTPRVLASRSGCFLSGNSVEGMVAYTSD